MDTAAIFILMIFLLFFHMIHAAELNTISNTQFLTDGDTLVSETGIFELGFFQPDGSENVYLGIWYKNITVRTVVWVANRDHAVLSVTPLVLKIVDPGALVLFNNMSMIWSSNTTTSGNANARLHDSGNLVLVDQQEKVMWQSFDYPTDTQLPGMKIGRDYIKGIEWRLSSWKSSQDPASSDITWGANIHGYPESKLKQGAVVIYRGGPWSNQRFPGLMASTLTYDVLIIKDEDHPEFIWTPRSLWVGRRE
uniref:G-type lectin S-receptor-like serine/threonine-protein kinase At4g27290 n=1 Tax=Erigeron canadensis TaxID=72917 RepID=UPI001CB95C62|nr:G-type lectin S-receptor-like serine/threonine-protein kinase At4g27290 [Erigeron canadensis]